MAKMNIAYMENVYDSRKRLVSAYQCSFEAEVPSDVEPEVLKSHITKTCALVREAVQEDISAGMPIWEERAAKRISRGRIPRRLRLQDASIDVDINGDPPPTPKQRYYLLGLAQERELGEEELASMAGVDSIDKISQRQCGMLISDLKKRPTPE